jgi:hypothetical protein
MSCARWIRLSRLSTPKKGARRMAEPSERVRAIYEMMKTLSQAELALLREWLDAFIKLQEVEAKMKVYAEESEKGGA